MTRKTVTEAGFYDGKFLKPGATYEDVESAEPGLDRMSKHELVAIAEERGIEVDASKAKADILAAITAHASK